MRLLSTSLFLLLLLVAAALAPSRAHAQESAFVVAVDSERLPEGVGGGEAMGELLARGLHAEYKGERPVEAFLVGGLLVEGEFVDEFRSRPFEVEPGRVRFPDGHFDRLFSDGYFERAFPDGHVDRLFPGTIFDIRFPDSTFQPGDVEERLAEVAGSALFVALLPAEPDLREVTASQAVVLVFGTDG